MRVERLTLSVQQRLSSFQSTLTTLADAEVRAREIVEGVLDDDGDLAGQLRTNCHRLAYMFPQHAALDIFQRHLDFLSRKYAFESFLLEHSQAALRHARNMLDEKSWHFIRDQWEQSYGRNPSLIVTYHFGPYYQLICTLAQIAKVALVSRVSGTALSTYQRLLDTLQTKCDVVLVSSHSAIHSVVDLGYSVIVVPDHTDFEQSRNTPARVGPLSINVRAGTIRLVEQFPIAAVACVGSYVQPERLIMNDLTNIDRKNRPEIGTAVFTTLAQMLELCPWEWDRLKYLHQMEVK